MADVYYAVAGHPVNHSLSPVLINIVAQHVSNQVKPSKRFNLLQTDLVKNTLTALRRPPDDEAANTSNDEEAIV